MKRRSLVTKKTPSRADIAQSWQNRGMGFSSAWSTETGDHDDVPEAEIRIETDNINLQGDSKLSIPDQAHLDAQPQPSTSPILSRRRRPALASSLATSSDSGQRTKVVSRMAQEWIQHFGIADEGIPSQEIIDSPLHSQTDQESVTADIDLSPSQSSIRMQHDVQSELICENDNLDLLFTQASKYKCDEEIGLPVLNAIIEVSCSQEDALNSPKSPGEISLCSSPEDKHAHKEDNEGNLCLAHALENPISMLMETLKESLLKLGCQTHLLSRTGKCLTVSSEAGNQCHLLILATKSNDNGETLCFGLPTVEKPEIPSHVVLLSRFRVHAISLTPGALLHIHAPWEEVVVEMPEGSLTLISPLGGCEVEKFTDNQVMDFLFNKKPLSTSSESVYKRIILKTFSAVTRTERYRGLFTTHSNAERPDDLDDWKERIHKIIMDQVC